MRWNCMSKALHFLQITAKQQYCPFFTVFLTIKTSSQNISITLLQISLKLHEHRGGYWRKKLPWIILEEQFSVPRNTSVSKIGNSVISLLWQLQCHCNPDHNKFSSLSDTTVVAIFPNVCLWRRSLCLNLAGIDPEKLYRATFICQYGLCCWIVWPSLLFDCFVKIWATCKNFFGQMVYHPPWQKIAHTPMEELSNFIYWKWVLFKLQFFYLLRCINYVQCL